LVENFFDSQKNLIQLTNDGLENTIYNGITDWLYEEEILLQTNAMWWSPESSKLAYLKFNDSLVEYYHFPIYDGTPYGSLNKVRYPKPDTKNPKVSIYIYSDQTKNSTELPIPKNFLLT
jgi:dipeptidyl aminopeptidase